MTYNFQKMICLDKKIMIQLENLKKEELKKEETKIEELKIKETKIEEEYFNINSQEMESIFFNIGTLLHNEGNK